MGKGNDGDFLKCPFCGRLSASFVGRMCGGCGRQVPDSPPPKRVEMKRSWAKPFTPIDFMGIDVSFPRSTTHYGLELPAAERLASHCNEIIAAMLAEAPVVMGNEDHRIWSGISGPLDTHRAKLVAIEEIET